MTLRRALVAYLKTRRALGFTSKCEASLLPQFVAFLDEQGSRPIRRPGGGQSA
jgi:hypothetical protein